MQLKITEEEVRLYQGAAERVLNISEYAFDYYYFIDRNPKSIEQLEGSLREKFPSKKMKFRPNDSNDELLALAEALKDKRKKLAALVLLDPFGMQLNWESIAKLKDTKSDVWILVPSGVVINRLLDQRGELIYSSKLETFFGLPLEEIRNFFYTKSDAPTLFDQDHTIVTKVPSPIKKIAELYVKQLKTVWEYVTDPPLVLENSSKSPIFHFVFASNNKTAHKIAKDIIKST